MNEHLKIDLKFHLNCGVVIVIKPLKIDLKFHLNCGQVIVIKPSFLLFQLS